MAGSAVTNKKTQPVPIAADCLRPSADFFVYMGEHRLVNHSPYEENQMDTLKHDEIRSTVRDAYGKIAESGTAGCGCSSTSCCGTAGAATAEDMSLGLGYSGNDVTSVPEGANMGLGCGNPQAIASLQAGETVLDLGSGGGFDSFLAARSIGEQGHVIGVDMTPEMVSKSRRNAGKTGLGNVEFRLGEIEHLPVADGVVDVIISNCVINLSPEKPKVFKEAFRVLKPGGRLAISDIVKTAAMPEAIEKDMAMYTGCIAGASSLPDLESMLRQAGFENIRIRPKDQSRAFIGDWLPGSRVEDYVVSATIEAVKPRI
jgi:arsenite methyltransferase